MVLNVFINLDTNLLILDPGHCIRWTHTTGRHYPRKGEIWTGKLWKKFFLVVQWQKVRVTIQLLWDGNDFQNLSNSYWIGLIMKWDFKILKLVVTCFPSLTCNSKSLEGLSSEHLHFMEWICLRILTDPFMVICS